MAKRIPALVEGAILTWARESAGYSIEDIATRFKKSPEAILAWEQGEMHPFMGQLRQLANLYKRPISDFYLPEVPYEHPIPHDFRRSPGTVAGIYSPALRQQLRFARERQELTKYLREDMGDPLPFFDYCKTLQESPEIVGAHIRKLLDVRIEEQRRWKDSRSGLKAWRKLIEARDVLVFQFEKVKVEEAWGFSIVESVYPVIGINKALAPNGRTFTMLHEFVHLLLGEGGICDMDDYTPRNRRELDIEAFCNHATAAALMPEEHFRHNPIVRSRNGQSAPDWQDDEIAEIAAYFTVSREAVVRRLLAFGLTTPKFYRNKRAIYLAQYKTQKKLEREQNKNRDFKGQNRAQRAMSDFGGGYVRLVLSSFGEGRITLADAAQYLEVRASAIRKIQELATQG